MRTLVRVLLWQCAYWVDVFGYCIVPCSAFICLLALFIAKKGVLISPTIIMELFFFPVNFGFLYPDILSYKCLWLLSLGVELKLK